jgi:hypothetical protein
VVEVRFKNLRTPDQLIEMPGVTSRLVELGDLTVGQIVTEPGWRWSTHMRPTVGGEWCQIRHVGVVLSGRLSVVFPDGTEIEFGPDEVIDIPPGHDGYTVGDEPCVQIEWAGLRSFFAGVPTGVRSRVLAAPLDRPRGRRRSQRAR